MFNVFNVFNEKLIQTYLLSYPNSRDAISSKNIIKSVQGVHSVQSMQDVQSVQCIQC